MSHVGLIGRVKRLLSSVLKGGVFKKHRTMPVLTLKILLTRED